jgi:hypothetical protein
LQLLVLSIACAPSNEPADAPFTVAAVVSDLTPERLREAVRAGVDRTAAELEAETRWLMVGSTDDGRETLAALGKDGTDLVFVAERGLGQWLVTEAATAPGTVFVAVPGRLRDANVGSIRFLPEEAGYVAGVTAAALSDSPRVAVVRGEGRLWLNTLEEGFVSGFSARRRQPVVDVTASRHDLPAFAESGVEIALYATERVEQEIIDAAAAVGLRLVVTDPSVMDDSPEVAVAAIRVDVAEAMLRVAREVHDGVFAGRVFSYDLGSGVLDVEINQKLPVEVRRQARDALEAARAEVTAGLVEFDEFGL